MRIAFLFLIFFIFFKEAGASHNLSYEFNLDKEDYRSHRISGSFDLFQYLSVGASYGYSKDGILREGDRHFEAKDYQLSLSSSPIDAAGGNIRGTHSDDIDLKSNGLGGGFYYHFSSLWNAEFNTTFLFDFGHAKYEADASADYGVLLSIYGEIDLKQTSYRFGLEQEAGYYFLIGAEYSIFDYNDGSFYETDSPWAILRVHRSVDASISYADRIYSLYGLFYYFEWFDFQTKYNHIEAIRNDYDAKEWEHTLSFYFYKGCSVYGVYIRNSSFALSETYGMGVNFVF